MTANLSLSTEIYNVGIAAAGLVAFVVFISNCLWWYRASHRRSVFVTPISASSVLRHFNVAKPSQIASVSIDFDADSPVTLRRFMKLNETAGSSQFRKNSVDQSKKRDIIGTDRCEACTSTQMDLVKTQENFPYRIDLSITDGNDTADLSMASLAAVTKVPLSLAMIIASEQVTSHSVSFTPSSWEESHQLPPTDSLGSAVLSFGNDNSSCVNLSFPKPFDEDCRSTPQRSASPYFVSKITPNEDRRIIQSDRTQV